MINRYKTQSISVNEEELQAIKELAARLRMKPAALARALFYRGLAAFLSDGASYADETDDEIFERLRSDLMGHTGRSQSKDIDQDGNIAQRSSLAHDGAL